jgi:hypothetical protein
MSFYSLIDLTVATTLQELQPISFRGPTSFSSIVI